MKNKKILFVSALLGIAALLYLVKKPTPAQEARPEISQVSQSSTNSLLPTENVVQVATPAENNSTENEAFDQPRKLTAKEIEELRSQTKAFLGGLYTAQKAFQAEYEHYITDIIAIGIASDPILPFKAGFLQSSTEELPDYGTDLNPRRLDTDYLIGEKVTYLEKKDTNYEEKTGSYQYAPFVRDINLSDYKEFCKQGCTAHGKNFEMLIATPLGNRDQVDVWIVNDKKEFVLVKDGTKSQIE